MSFEKNLAQLLVQYSVRVKKGDLVLIYGPIFAEDLIREIYIEVLKAGGHPLTKFEMSGEEELLYTYGSDDQLKHFSPLKNTLMEKFQKLIRINALFNTRRLELVDPAKIQTSSATPENVEFTKFMMGNVSRENEDAFYWVLAPYPCDALAQDAGMGTYAYKDFIESALQLNNNPVDYWNKVRAEQERIIAHLNKVDKIQVLGDDTDLTLSVKERKWINCCGEVNLPDGEVFTGPIENSLNGHIRFTYPGIFRGKEIEDIYLEFKNGKVTKGTALKGQDLLEQILQIEGANCIGEFAVGTNYNITKFTKNMLFDEKMGGTLHMALGMGIPATGSKSVSAIHWDILKDMKSTDSKIIADEKVIYEAGHWKI
jgi:aminopeptidase